MNSLVHFVICMLPIVLNTLKVLLYFSPSKLVRNKKSVQETTEFIHKFLNILRYEYICVQGYLLL